MSLEEYDLDRAEGHCEHCASPCGTERTWVAMHYSVDPSNSFITDQWYDSCRRCADLATGAERERDRIAKWMKEQGWESLRPGGTSQLLADAIERGDHLKESI